MNRVLPWSWSNLEAYITCPKRYYEVKIAKSVKEPEGDHLVWGGEVHKAFELAVGEARPMPDRMKQWQPLANSLRLAPGDKYCELKTAVDYDLEPCDFFDNDNCWNRGVEDLLIINGPVAVDIDYKTGKQKKYSRQLELSAARVFATFPEVKVVNTAYAWLATGKWTRAQFKREQLGELWSGFYQDIENMLWSEQNNVWPAKPSGLCKRSKKPGSTYMGCPVTNCPHSENYKRGT